MSIATVPSMFFEVAFNADPNQNTVPPYWSDLTARAQFGFGITRGRQYELDQNECGTLSIELDNHDGALDPGNSSSPYSPNVQPYRQCRLRLPLGNNLLCPDQASSGEYAPLLAGPVPPWLGVTSASGYPVSVAVVGASAYQGTQVFTVTVPSGVAAPKDVVDVAVRQLTVGQAYTFTAQAQVTTSGQNLNANVAIDWLSSAGAVVSTTSGTGSLLTGAAGTWTQLTVSGTAPATAAAATLRLVCTTTPSANATFWIDGLQLEARSYATRWQMPWVAGVNLLPQTVATGLETMNPATDVPTNWFTATHGTLARATNLTAAPTGATTALSWALPTASTPATSALFPGLAPAGAPYQGAYDCFQAIAGQAYTASVYLSRLASADATVQLAFFIQWYTQTNGQISNTAITTATVGTTWSRATVTGTAPAGAAFGRLCAQLATPASTTAANTIYFAGWQVEAAGTASTWADPGITAYLFTGFVEQWPRVWNQLNGLYGTSQLSCVDAFAGLAQPQLTDPFVNEVMALNPNFFFQLAEPAGATACIDTTGKRVPAPVLNSPYGTGSLVFGSSITSTNPTLSIGGSTGSVATFNNNPGSFQLPETYIALDRTTLNPGPPTTSWTRMIAFRASTTPGSGTYQIWCSSPRFATEPSFFEFTVLGSGDAFISFGDSAGGGGSWSSPASVCDGNWHLMAVGVDQVSGNCLIWFDGALVSTTGGTNVPADLKIDVIGCLIQPDLSVYGGGFRGDAAFAVEFGFCLTNTQMTNLYNSFRTGSSGESSGARYQRVLTWLGWPGRTAIDTGSTSSMGPATDIIGSTGLDALNLITATESGDQYVSASGAMTFKARSAFYNSRTPTFIVGEGSPIGALGEWPAEAGTSIDYDPLRTAPVIQVTQYNGPVATAQDAAAKAKYFPRTYQRTINTTSIAEVNDASDYLLSQYKAPKQRTNSIRLHPSAIYGLWPVAAQLDKNVRMRFNKRPIGAPATSLDLFLQRLEWSVSANWDATLTLQGSPADLSNYWQLAALRTTLNAQAASGQNQATINALQDAAVNKLAQSLPSGYQLVFEPGSPRQETMTLAPTGIPSTSLGYSTATLTFTGNFAFTHPANSTVCEPLPAGYTDPTTWDAASILGVTYTTIVSGGASGTNTVTVGQLADYQTNPLGSNWNTGDQITLSPGTVNAETITILSVAATYPGYSTCQITATANFTHNHTAGDYACDPLPVGVNTPTAVAATTRVAY